MYWEPAPLYNGCALQRNDIHEAFLEELVPGELSVLRKLQRVVVGLPVLFFFLRCTLTNHVTQNIIKCSYCAVITSDTPDVKAGCVLQHSRLFHVERKEEDTREASV